MVAMSKRLRKSRLARERVLEPLSSPVRRPDLYYDHAPCGSYPIIALRTVPCDRYIKGQCTPCSYSARSYPAGLGREAIYAALESQIEWILERFDECVASHASGRLDGYQLRSAPDRPWYMLQLAGESSFFRDAEIPPSYRRRILERLVEFQDVHQVNLHVMLECRPEDLLAAHDGGELDRLRPLFKALDVVINMGLEYRDEWLRNTLFAKGLGLEAFERAVCVAHKHRLDPGVFVFAGGPLLTTGEVLRETSRTLRYLERLKVFANLMVPNLQAQTLPDLLWEMGAYELPDPYFVLDVVDLALAYRPRRPNAVTPFDWFLGGIESDPPPRATLFSNPRNRTSQGTSEEIHKTLIDLVRTMDAENYCKRVSALRRKPEAETYRSQKALQDPRPWDRRLAAALSAVPDNMDGYAANI